MTGSADEPAIDDSSAAAVPIDDDGPNIIRGGGVHTNADDVVDMDTDTDDLWLGSDLLGLTSLTYVHQRT